MRYKVYFEIYGKKMVATVTADAEWEAKEFIRERIRFDKIEKIDDDGRDIFGLFRDMGITI